MISSSKSVSALDQYARTQNNSSHTDNSRNLDALEAATNDSVASTISSKDKVPDFITVPLGNHDDANTVTSATVASTAAQRRPRRALRARQASTTTGLFHGVLQHGRIREIRPSWHGQNRHQPPLATTDDLRSATQHETLSQLSRVDEEGASQHPLSADALEAFSEQSRSNPTSTESSLHITESQRQAIEAIVRQVQRTHRCGFFKFSSPLPGNINSRPSQEELASLGNTISKEAMSDLLLTSTSTRQYLVHDAGMPLSQELVNEVLERAADLCEDINLSTEQTEELVIAATTLLETFVRSQMSSRCYNPDEFLTLCFETFKPLAKNRMYPGIADNGKSGGAILGMLSAATHRYVDERARPKNTIRNVAAFLVCCFWAWSFPHKALPLAAAIVVSSYALYELVVPKIKHPFDVSKLNRNLRHAVYRGVDNYNHFVKEGTDLTMSFNKIKID